MNINFEYYKIFYYVAKSGSFSAAAKILLNNQPNITRTVKKLESELGCVLFIRQKNGVLLTPEGERLYNHIKVAVEHIVVAENEISEINSLQSGTVTVSASEIALHCALLPVLKDFHNKYPSVKIKVSNQSTPQAIKSVKDGFSDLAVVTAPLSETNKLKSTVLRSIKEVPVYHKKIDKTLSFEELVRLPIISLAKETTSYRFYERVFYDNNVNFEPDIEVATADQILPLIKSGLGVGFVPVEFLLQNTDSNNLFEIQLTEKIPSRQICLIEKDNANLNIAGKELKKMIYAVIDNRIA